MIIYINGRKASADDLKTLEELTKNSKTYATAKLTKRGNLAIKAY